METQYILIRKNKSEAKSIRIQNEIKAILKEVAFDVGSNLIYFSKDDDKYVTYRMSYEDNNVLYLNITTNSRGEPAAIMLDEFNERLIKGPHRRKFHIINAYSDSSHWFCSKLMPKIGTFERLLREFIYLTVTKVYGSEWVKNLDSELVKHLEEISHGEIRKGDSLIEKSLEWLEFKELEDILFTPRVYDNVDVDSIVNDVLSNESLTKEEIIALIKTIEKKSLWERVFQGFSDVNDLQGNFSNIRSIRNTVMHNKYITHIYFEESLHTIEKLNRQLSKSIEKIEKDVYDKPKDPRTIVFDGKVFVEAIFKSIQQDEEMKRKEELGKKRVERLNKLYGATKMSDLIDTRLGLNDIITQKFG